jgi:hypothetical protein
MSGCERSYVTQTDMCVCDVVPDRVREVCVWDVVPDRVGEMCVFVGMKNIIISRNNRGLGEATRSE